VKKEDKQVDVSRLGFRFAQHQLRKMFDINEISWRRDRWAALISAGLQAYLLYLRDVDYAVMRSPVTGKTAIVLIDQSTSARPCSARVTSWVAHSLVMRSFGWQLMQDMRC
jgi:preprotein translocase subunit SecA